MPATLSLMRSVLEKLGIGGDETPGAFDGEWRGG